MKKTMLDVMKISVLLMLAPMSPSNACDRDKNINIPAITRQQSSGLEVEFPLFQTIILDL